MVFPPVGLHSRKPIATMADIRGTKMSAQTRPTGESIERLGGVPITMQIAELYPSLQRGVIDVATIEKVIAEAQESGAAIVGVVPVDTVKQVHRNKIRATIPRDRLVLAQTPQVFRFDLLKEAFAQATSDNFTGTDEASLVERLEQVEVSVVAGSDRNIKLTKPTDMQLAHLFLAEERGQ